MHARSLPLTWGGRLPTRFVTVCRMASNTSGDAWEEKESMTEGWTSATNDRRYARRFRDARASTAPSSSSSSGNSRSILLRTAARHRCATRRR